MRTIKILQDLERSQLAEEGIEDEESKEKHMKEFYDYTNEGLRGFMWMHADELEDDLNVEV